MTEAYAALATAPPPIGGAEDGRARYSAVAPNVSHWAGSPLS